MSTIEIKGLNVNYGKLRALEDIDLKVEKDDFLAIMGPNGGGKSTLIRSILGLVPVNSGSISLFGDSVKKGRHLVGYVPQFSGIDKNFPVTVLEVVLLGSLDKGLSLFHKFSKKERIEAMALLEKVGLGNLGDRMISQLSGGEFQKMLIARALMSSPKVLLLDEPTANVDKKSTEEIYCLLSELNQDMTILMVTHDVMAISSYVKGLACLNVGLVYHGEPSLTEEVVEKLFGCPVELVAHGIPHRVLKEHDRG